MRKNLTNVDTRDMNFVFPSAVPTNPGSGTHGGEDIGIYAIGNYNNFIIFFYAQQLNKQDCM